MTLVACYVAHEAGAELARSILSVKAYVDAYVIVEGAFASNPAPLRSGDDTVQVAAAACAGVPLELVQPGRKLEEHEARQRYLDAAAGPDTWLLLMDSDEVLYAEHAEFAQLVADLPGVAARALQLQVLTTAVLAPLDAPAIDASLYARAPRIGTAGWMPKLVRWAPTLAHVRQETVPGIWTHHGLRDGAGGLHDEPRVAGPLVVNDHAGQGHAGYQHDFRWEMAQRHALEALP